jgi:neutral ceramidase
MNQGLIAGAAKAVITLPENFFPYRSFLDRYFIGQHDDIYVRALILKNGSQSAAFITMDLAEVGDIPQWQQRISQISRLPEDHIFIAATHNHMSPYTSDDLHMNIKDIDKTADFNENLKVAVDKAVKEAVDNLQPARLAYSEGSCDINCNRDYYYQDRFMYGPNTHGISDKTVAVLTVETSDGKPFAVLCNYAVHGSVMMGAHMTDDGGMLIGGDLPGETSRDIEKWYDYDVVALWTSGAAGNQNPRYFAKYPVFNRDKVDFVDEKDKGYALLDAQARDLADEIIRLINERTGATSEVDIQAGQRKHHMKCLPRPDRTPEHFSYYPPFFDMSIGVVRLNDVVIVCVPGEPICELGLKVKKALEDQYKVIVLTLCNGSFSYMSDEEGFDAGKCASTHTRLTKGGAESLIVNGSLEILRDFPERRSFS